MYLSPWCTTDRQFLFTSQYHSHIELDQWHVIGNQWRIYSMTSNSMVSEWFQNGFSMVPVWFQRGSSMVSAWFSLKQSFTSLYAWFYFKLTLTKSCMYFLSLSETYEWSHFKCTTSLTREPPQLAKIFVFSNGKHCKNCNHSD